MLKFGFWLKWRGQPTLAAAHRVFSPIKARIGGRRRGGALFHKRSLALALPCQHGRCFGKRISPHPCSDEAVRSVSPGRRLALLLPGSSHLPALLPVSNRPGANAVLTMRDRLCSPPGQFQPLCRMGYAVSDLMFSSAIREVTRLRGVDSTRRL
jgi:hypothetical protein